MNLLWMDVETTGLNPKRHAIIDICLAETDVRGREVKRYTSKIKPSQKEIGEADPRALEVNKYNPDDWDDAPSIYEVVNAIHKVDWSQSIPAGWNVPFDLSFLKETALELPISYHPLDLMGVAWRWLLKRDPAMNEKVRLSSLCTMLGVPVVDAHTASGDVDMSIRCYRELI